MAQTKYYDDSKPFSEQLKAARKKLGLSQAALAKATQISQRTIERWEVGDRTPTKWTAEMLLEKLHRNFVPEEKSRDNSMTADLDRMIADVQADEDLPPEEKVALIDSIADLIELARAQEEIDEWDDELEAYINGDIDKMPEHDIDALCKKYPSASGYIRVAAEHNKYNYELCDINRKAAEAIAASPDKRNEIMANLQAEIIACADKTDEKVRLIAEEEEE